MIRERRRDVLDSRAGAEHGVDAGPVLTVPGVVDVKVIVLRVLRHVPGRIDAAGLDAGIILIDLFNEGQVRRHHELRRRRVIDFWVFRVVELEDGVVVLDSRDADLLVAVALNLYDAERLRGLVLEAQYIIIEGGRDSPVVKGCRDDNRISRRVRRESGHFAADQRVVRRQLEHDGVRLSLGKGDSLVELDRRTGHRHDAATGHADTRHLGVDADKVAILADKGVNVGRELDGL